MKVKVYDVYPLLTDSIQLSFTIVDRESQEIVAAAEYERDAYIIAGYFNIKERSKHGLEFTIGSVLKDAKDWKDKNK